jgi:hypothetical protein
MDLRDTLSALLPPPRDGEPPSLRQDILDELGDHLACAHNRELLRGVNAQLARKRVLERFGDPAAVARRLWLDAMKGKIMVQRLLIATCLVVMMVSLSLVGLVWIQSSRATVQATEANRKLSEALVQSQLVNKDMMKTLSEMSDAIRNPRSPDWNPVKIKLTEDTVNGPPAVGCSVQLPRSEGGNTTIDRTTDDSGIADFGLLHPGTYTFSLSRSSDYRTLTGSGRFDVEPGSNVTKRIICPTKALERVPVRVRCDWPADLEKEGLVVDASFTFVPLVIEETSWSASSRSVLCGPGAGLAEILVPGGLYLWAAAPVPTTTFRAAILKSQVRWISESAEPLKWERGTYRLSELIVLRPFRAATDNAGRQRFEILRTCSPWPNDRNYVLRPEPPTDEDLSNGQRFGNGHVVGPRDLAIESWGSDAGRFDAGPDRMNVWTIALPEKLIDVVRAKLKAEANPPPY